jgi:hypothetical protein
MDCAVHGRIADGNRGLGAVRGTVGFARTATDGDRIHGRATDQVGGGGAVRGLTFAVELSVHVPCVRPLPGRFPGAGRPGKGGCGDGQGGGPGERDACREGGAGAGRPRVRVPCQVNVLKF